MYFYANVYMIHVAFLYVRIYHFDYLPIKFQICKKEREHTLHTAQEQQRQTLYISLLLYLKMFYGQFQLVFITIYSFFTFTHFDEQFIDHIIKH